MHMILKAFLHFTLYYKSTTQTIYTYTIINETLEFSFYAMLISLLFLTSYRHFFSLAFSLAHQLTDTTCSVAFSFSGSCPFQRYFLSTQQKKSQSFFSPFLHEVVSWFQSARVLATHSEFNINICSGKIGFVTDSSHSKFCDTKWSRQKKGCKVKTEITFSIHVSNFSEMYVQYLCIQTSVEWLRESIRQHIYITYPWQQLEWEVGRWKSDTVK